MNRIEQAKSTMEKKNLTDSYLLPVFPEYVDIKNNFIYGEVFQKHELDSKTQLLVTIAALVTSESDDLEEILQVALGQGLDPIELQEVFHQAAPYVGFPKVEKGLKVLRDVFANAGLTLPLPKQCTVSEQDRLEKGISAQKMLFGEMIDAMRANAPENQKFMQDYLSAYCFGDTYTRAGLDLKTRELLTFVCIICLGGCDSQANSHAIANLFIGNGPEILYAAVAQSLPYIGFPKSLNAMSAINNAISTLEQMQQQNTNAK
ncbi:MAG: carboxymuconolactone decarboxylase family protein [Erysipelotrichaceae bacterium]|nr:carboxymuconolactone decarboxylase family protein [Erysipelotrichaceae bacterium]